MPTNYNHKNKKSLKSLSRDSEIKNFKGVSEISFRSNLLKTLAVIGIDYKFVGE